LSSPARSDGASRSSSVPVFNKFKIREHREAHLHYSSLINFFSDALSATEHGVYLDACLYWRHVAMQEDVSSERIEIRLRA
jgi:hypothetical protein